MKLKMNNNAPIKFLAVIFTVLALSTFGSATAFDQQVYNNLLKSRDALLEQKQYLQSAYDEVSTSLEALQVKQDRLNKYLDQNDRALRDVDTTLRSLR